MKKIAQWQRIGRGGSKQALRITRGQFTQSGKVSLGDPKGKKKLVFRSARNGFELEWLPYVLVLVGVKGIPHKHMIVEDTDLIRTHTSNCFHVHPCQASSNTTIMW